jgi:hypothetical protein
MAIGKTNAGGSSGSGGTLTVTGIAGDIVTVSKDGKTYTRTFNSSGVAVFKGLSTGTWTVTMTNSAGQTATRTVEITADYTLTIAYFSATISITYPAQSTCVIKNSSGTQVASDTNTGTSAKAWTTTVDASGTYTITATATDGSGKTKSTTVSITAEGQVETVTLTFEMILFDNGIIGDVKWDASKVDDSTYCTNSVSDVIWLSGIVYDNGLIFVAPSATRGISSAIDLTNYNKVNVRVKQVLSNTGTAKIYVGTSALGDQIATANIALTDGQISSLDISSVTESKYISIYVRPTDGTYGNKIDVKFDKVWLE